MKQKIFLTSAIALGFTYPAMAVPTNTGEFPSGGLMQEDYTYTNAATSTNMAGVYEGTVDAVAQYTDILYNIAAGNYLAGGSELTDGTECPAGSWCPGLTNVTYSANDQGINTCPNGFTSSLAGSSSDTQCFRTCDINNMGTSFSNIAHATAVSGNDYYGNGTDTCEPSACVNGYHVEAGFNLSTTLANARTDDYASTVSSGEPDYENGWGLDAEDMGIAGDPSAFVEKYQKLEGTGRQSQWVDKGYVYGHGLCSKQGGQTSYNQETHEPQTPTTVSSLTNETGQSGAVHCWCSISGYKADMNSTMKSLSSSWVYAYEYGDVTACGNFCASTCERFIRNGNNSEELETFRPTLFATVTTLPATCEANTITINWNGTTQAAIDANNAGTATYDGDIRTPQSASHVPGKTFTGWRFSKPTQTNLP